jgi:hypothetical protein
MRPLTVRQRPPNRYAAADEDDENRDAGETERRADRGATAQPAKPPPVPAGRGIARIGGVHACTV